MRLTLLLAFLVVAVPDRPDPDKGANQSDNRPLTERLQGEWQVVTSLSAGKPHTGVKPGDAVFIFAGDKLSITRPNLTNVYEYTIDPSKSPMAFTMKARTLNGKETKTSAPATGIIKIEGDMVSICLRPINNEFASNVSTTTILWQVKRK